MQTTANKAAFLIQSRLNAETGWHTEAKSSTLELATKRAEKIRREYKGAIKDFQILAADGTDLPSDAWVYVTRDGSRVVWARF